VKKLVPDTFGCEMRWVDEELMWDEMEIWNKDERGNSFLYQIPPDNLTMNSLQQSEECYHVTQLANVWRLELEGPLSHKAAGETPRRPALYRKEALQNN